MLQKRDRKYSLRNGWMKHQMPKTAQSHALKTQGRVVSLILKFSFTEGSFNLQSNKEMLK